MKNLNIGEQTVWSGEVNRPFTLSRPCPCGCDERGGYKGVGYLSGSDKNGNGFTIWIGDEAGFKAVKATMDEYWGF